MQGIIYIIEQFNYAPGYRSEIREECIQIKLFVRPISDSGMSMLPDIRIIELSHKADWVMIAECNRADSTSFHNATMRYVDAIDQSFSVLCYPSGILHKLTHLMIVYAVLPSWWCCVYDMDNVYVDVPHQH